MEVIKTFALLIYLFSAAVVAAAVVGESRRVPYPRRIVWTDWLVTFTPILNLVVAVAILAFAAEGK